MTIKPYEELDVYGYTKATYYQNYWFHQWSYDSMNKMSLNMLEQHTQMRQELQNRHQDITNDVNQCEFGTLLWIARFLSPLIILFRHNLHV